jgi:tRNA-specific 2-thiouridylase
MLKQNIVVGLSGGVDSAVTAQILKEQGHNVTGLFMKNWEADDDDEYCSSKQDLIDAISVAEKIGIDIEVVNFAKEYKEKVFNLFLHDINLGLTPNPDILCNSEIKFEAFLNHAMELGADKIATGHYANVKEINGNFYLSKGDDSSKDQSYFLHKLNQKQLSKSIFPLGKLLKKEVREIAKLNNLHNHERKDSTGICFIGERPFAEFLNQFIKKNPGDIVNDSGKVIGTHDGLMFYTIGQRQGLGIGGTANSNGKPWFVAKKNIEANTLLAVQGHDHPLLLSDSLIANNLHIIGNDYPIKKVIGAKTRYRQPDAACQIDEINDGTLKTHFGQKQWAITPGQYVVFYESNVCLGGGIIKSAFNSFE